MCPMIYLRLEYIDKNDDEVSPQVIIIKMQTSNDHLTLSR